MDGQTDGRTGGQTDRETDRQVYWFIAFWQCWRSKFESVNKCSHVEGCADPDIIVNKFAMNFQKTYFL